ncbi:MAG: FHA domain-containing protein [Lachnospiraceae bacterium]|nr:FHA domain-containing protein [Lachnospiraceae bacterium]
MDYRYFSDTDANYLVIRCSNPREQEPERPGQINTDLSGSGADPQQYHRKQALSGSGLEPQDSSRGYQYRMLAANSVEGLLPCACRSINGQQYLYYDITSRQNLEDLYGSYVIEASLVKRLLYAIVDTGEALGNYLLEDNRILLRPEFVYYDFGTDRYYFIYYPGTDITDGNSGNGGKELFEFLLASSDPADAESAYILYRLSEAASYSGFRLQRSFLDREYRTFEQTSDMEEEGIAFLDSGGESREAQPYGQTARRQDFSEYDPLDRPGRRETEAQTHQNREFLSGNAGIAAEPGGSDVKKAGVRQGMEDLQETSQNNTAKHCLLGAAAALSIAVIFELMLQKIILPVLDLDPWKLQIRSGVLTLIILSLFLAGSSVFITYRAHRDKKNPEAEKKEEKSTHSEHSTVSGMEYSVQIGAVQNIRKDTSEEYDYRFDHDRAPAEPDHGQEKTIAQAEKNRTLNKLYGTGAARSYRIDLNNLPCTVGRDPRYAGIVLRDPSISPVHARFEADGENVLMTDLNSVYGILLNGEALSARETIGICPGDEVQLGELTFIYR